MGCDIHTVIEKKVGEKWIGVLASDCAKDRPAYARRDYDFFAKIANVRGRGEYYPQNVPHDVSELAWHLYMRCPTDHHSPSHMSIELFCQLHHQMNPSMSRPEYCVGDLTGLWPDEDGPYRVVFWFDN